MERFLGQTGKGPVKIYGSQDLAFRQDSSGDIYTKSGEAESKLVRGKEGEESLWKETMNLCTAVVSNKSKVAQEVLIKDGNGELTFPLVCPPEDVRVMPLTEAVTHENGIKVEVPSPEVSVVVCAWKPT